MYWMCCGAFISTIITLKKVTKVFPLDYFVSYVIIIIVKTSEVTALFLRTFMTRRNLGEFICATILVLVFLLCM